MEPAARGSMHSGRETGGTVSGTESLASKIEQWSQRARSILWPQQAEPSAKEHEWRLGIVDPHEYSNPEGVVSFRRLQPRSGGQGLGC